MYGPLHTHDQLWGESLLPESGIHAASGASIIRLPPLRSARSFDNRAIKVDPALRTRFWRLAVPTLGLFWAGVIWAIAT